MKSLVFSVLIMAMGCFGKTEVIYQKGEILINNKALTKNHVFQKSDTLETKDKAFIILKFAESLTLKLKENSKIILGDFAKTEFPESVELKSGAIFSQLHHLANNQKLNYQVKTKTTVMGVRGTHFFASTDGVDKDWMCVNEGQVEVTQNSSGKKIQVKAGEGVFVTSGQLDHPKAYQWTKRLNWNHDTKNGLVKDELDVNNIYSVKENYYD